MFKIILFMHGRLAEEFIRASALVFGEQKEMELTAWNLAAMWTG